MQIKKAKTPEASGLLNKSGFCFTIELSLSELKITKVLNSNKQITNPNFRNTGKSLHKKFAEQKSKNPNIIKNSKVVNANLAVIFASSSLHTFR
jgi:hypothetical protein